MLTLSAQSIPVSLFEWILTIAPGFAILVFTIWCISRSYAWLNSKFSLIDQTVTQKAADTERKFMDVDMTLHQHTYQLENVDKRLTAVEADLKTVIVNVQKVQTDLAVLDTKVEQKFETVNQRFEAIDKRFDTIDKRFETMDKRFDAMDKRFDVMDKRFDAMDRKFDVMDKKFEAQNEFNQRMLSLLESALKNNLQSNTNPDLRIQKT